ncbi:hypothetical protein AAHE18_06G264800 [Arachis hypogaea]
MGWLSKFFKGSDQKISEGHYHSYYNGDADSYLPSTSGDVWPENENEDIDRAIALSLAEQNHRGNHVNEEDEQLARAIEESLNLESPPKYGNENMYQPHPTVPIPVPVYFPMGSSFLHNRICAGCHTEIGYGRYLNCLNAFWHPECFRCHACNLPISDYEFSTSGNYPYHKSCYKESYHPKCDVCKHFIPTNPAGLIEYRAHPFWVQKYCPSHEHDNTPRCCSCERMEPRETGYIGLNDGQKLCLECLDSAIMDTSECQPLYHQIPLLLVETQALNEAREGEEHVRPLSHAGNRGLCLSEEQTISSISRRPRLGAGNRAVDMRTQPYKLTRRCDVTAILILFGLPRLLTGSILAHEMMHAWLRLKGYRTLSQNVEEGICQVMAYMWLHSELTSASASSSFSTSRKGKRPPFETKLGEFFKHQIESASSSSSTSRKGKRPPFEMKLGEFFKHQIESDISPVYGDGFRAGHQAVQKYGLQKTLNHIWMTGTFPF